MSLGTLGGILALVGGGGVKEELRRFKHSTTFLLLLVQSSERCLILKNNQSLNIVFTAQFRQWDGKRVDFYFSIRITIKQFLKLLNKN